jgi:threonine synthase
MIDNISIAPKPDDAWNLAKENQRNLHSVLSTTTNSTNEAILEDDIAIYNDIIELLNKKYKFEVN